nr:energy transducer TonB [Rhodoferax sp.]
MSRNVRIVVTVVLLHAGGLWALQAGLMRRVVEVFVPAQVIVEMQDPVETPRPPTPTPVKAQVTPTQQPVPLAAAKPAPEPSPIAPAPVVEAASTPVVAEKAVVVAPTAVVAPPAPKVELPSSDADYLNNPKPPYPPISKRMGEQGDVVIRTLIAADGTAKEASIFKSSGFDRLDQTALATALKWHYVPGKRAGVAEAMWFNVPFSFVLEKSAR